MKFTKEHIGIINTSTMVTFDLPKYVGLLTYQIHYSKFGGDIKVKYKSMAGIEKNIITDFSSMVGSTGSKIISIPDKAISLSFNISFPDASVGSIDKITVSV